MTVTKQGRGALLLPLGSLGVPRSVLCSQSEVLHVLENGLGKGKSISTALVCVTNSLWPPGSTLGHSCAVSQALFIPVPGVLVSVLGMEGTAQHGSVPQGESHFGLQLSCTVLSTLWDGVSQPPALRSKFEGGIGIFVVCLSGVFSLLPNSTKETLPSVALGSL